MLFLIVSTPPPERPTELAAARQSFWHWIARHEASGVCRHIYPRVGRGAVAVLDVESNEALHLILNEWADIIRAHFDTYPLVDLEATNACFAGGGHAGLMRLVPIVRGAGVDLQRHRQ
jgi:hypothetical protein